ncbi:MAG TPA: hypothetical protein VKZ18_24890 [Polyangia bacterium]|nr:hypothetical protein [Polyangia bacterium]
MHTKSKRSMFVAMAFAGAVLAAGAPAFALSVTGFTGKTTPSSSSNCMTESNGAVYNNCGAQTTYEIPLAVNQGSHNVTISYYNAGGGTFWCQLVAVDNIGRYCPPTGCTITSQVFMNTVGSPDQVTTPSVTVPGQGSLYLTCNVNPYSKIYNVNYSE